MLRAYRKQNLGHVKRVRHVMYKTWSPAYGICKYRSFCRYPLIPFDTFVACALLGYLVFLVFADTS